MIQNETSGGEALVRMLLVSDEHVVGGCDRNFPAICAITELARRTGCAQPGILGTEHASRASGARSGGVAAAILAGGTLNAKGATCRRVLPRGARFARLVVAASAVLASRARAARAVARYTSLAAPLQGSIVTGVVIVVVVIPVLMPRETSCSEISW